MLDLLESRDPRLDPSKLPLWTTGAVPGRAVMTRSSSATNPPEVLEKDTSTAAPEFERERLKEEKMDDDELL